MFFSREILLSKKCYLRDIGSFFSLSDFFAIIGLKEIKELFSSLSAYFWELFFSTNQEERICKGIV